MKDQIRMDLYLTDTGFPVSSFVASTANRSRFEAIQPIVTILTRNCLGHYELKSLKRLKLNHEKFPNKLGSYGLVVW